MKDTILWSKSIKMTTFELLHNNKNQFFTSKQIKLQLLKTQKWLRDIDCVKWLAFTDGLSGKITSSIHLLKNDGHPIISSDEHGKGYTYLDSNNSDTPLHWDSVLTANEKRENVPKEEKRLYNKLFLKTLEQCTNPSIRAKMRKIAIKHKLKKEKEEEEE